MIGKSRSSASCDRRRVNRWGERFVNNSEGAANAASRVRHVGTTLRRFRDGSFRSVRLWLWRSGPRDCRHVSHALGDHDPRLLSEWQCVHNGE